MAQLSYCVRSRQQPRKPWPDPVGNGQWKMAPRLDCESIQRAIGGRYAGVGIARPRRPGERDITPAPLLLETVGASTRAAASEVEDAYPALHRVLHEPKIQQHVR